MFDEPEDVPAKRSVSPDVRARDKIEELRMHAELAAVFEGCRKFGSELLPGLDAAVARDVQLRMGKLEKARVMEKQVLPLEELEAANELLALGAANGLGPNDYHIQRRPGQAVVVRWLEGDQVDTFYGRLQAHFDAAIEGEIEDERQAHEWQEDVKSTEYIAALEKGRINMSDRYLRDPVKSHGLAMLSTQTADEMNIAHLCDFIMGLPAAELVGEVSAPPMDPTDQDLAWFFKLYLLRGASEGVERACFFTFLQKTDDGSSDW